MAALLSVLRENQSLKGQPTEECRRPYLLSWEQAYLRIVRFHSCQRQRHGLLRLLSYAHLCRYLQRNEIESFEANVFESFSDNLGFTYVRTPFHVYDCKIVLLLLCPFVTTSLLEGNPGASQCTSGGNFESQEVCSGNPTFCYTEPVGPLPTCIPCAPQV